MAPTLLRQFATNRYRSKRLSQMFLGRYSLLNIQNISINNGEKSSLKGHTSDEDKHVAEVAQKKVQQLAHGEF